MKGFEGKVALISGVARGQGASHAIELASRGVSIIGFDVLEEIPGSKYPGSTIDDLNDTIRKVESVGGKILAKRADVRIQDQVSEIVSEGVGVFGRLDFVSANAGIFTAPALTEDLEEDVFLDMINVNLNGVWRTCKAAIPHMKKSGNGGSIVITSSALGMKASAYYSHYISSKVALVGLMKSMALELGDYGIRVNTIHPTMVNTRQLEADKEHWASANLNLLPTPWVEPIDISNALMFLCSDEARYITGATLPVDAGFGIL
jgi:SDR family mycofactocin-dependent oxidoreductase